MAAERGNPSNRQRVAIVTGGGHADGQVIARELASAGFAIALVHLCDRAEADLVIDQILAAGGCAVAVRADLEDDMDVERLFDETGEAFGGVDLLVHVAGAADLTVVNRQAAGRLRAGGAILNVKSSAERVTTPAPALAQELLRRARASTSGFPGGDAGRTAQTCTDHAKEDLMSSTSTGSGTSAGAAGTALVDMKLEAVVIPVADVDRAKEFYTGLGWRLDADFPFDNGFRVVQLTPPGSGCSIQFGTEMTSAAPGSTQDLYLIVSDIEAARDALIARGADVSEVFHADEPGAQFQLHGTADRVSGPAPDDPSYRTFATFRDPDGNGWLIQQIITRLPGRIDPETTFTSVPELAAALRRAAAAHGEHEKRMGGEYDTNWPDWYAEYMVRDQAGEELPT